MLDGVEMVHLRAPSRCACGEGLGAGEQAGRVRGQRGLLCLWCLADLQAGRPRPQQRAGAGPWPVAPPPSPTRRRRPPRHGRRSTVMTLVVVLLVTAGALYVRLNLMGDSAPASAGGVRIPGTDLIVGADPVAASDIRRSWPPVPSDASSEPLGSPAPQASSSTDYLFMATVNDRPVAWDPCRPIHLVVNTAEAPVGADQLLREAVGQVSTATGLQFVVDGTTDEAPTTARQPMDRDRYGNKWSPVLVAWTNPSVVPELSGRIAGVAGPASAPYHRSEEMHFVSGTVSLDAPDLAQILQRPDGWALARAIVMHEVGHLVGLAHAPQPTELMAAQNVGRTAFGPGDLEGLRRLGGGRCFS